jgi:two-component system response regulator YesN
MRIVIADDEPLVRISLNSMIQEMEASWEIVGEAGSGEELLRLLAGQQPEVAIVDIRMPKLDGLEAIRRGKELSPRTRWIILSGFSDFRYAQQALRLGANEYLLKPVNPDELEKALHAVSMQNREYAYLLNCQFENRLFALVHGLTNPASEPRDSLLRKGHFQALVFHFDSPLEVRELEPLKGAFIDNLRLSVPDYLVRGLHLALFTMTGAEYVLAGVWEPELADARESARRFFRHAEEAARLIRSGELAVTTVQSDPCDCRERFFEHLREIQEHAGFHIVCGMNRTWTFAQMKRASEPEERLKLGRLFLRLACDCRNRLYLNYQHTLEEIGALLAGMPEELLTGETRRNIREYVRLAFGVDLADGEWRTWIRKLKEWGEHWLRRNADGAEPQDLVDQMLLYIDQHYMKNNIGLNQIAGELNVTPSYLSALFHKKTGTTFIKYLTRLRILKAKELLVGTNLQIRQIAEQVGYHSTRYFTRLFVDMVGAYPSDYRKKARGEEHAVP